MNKTTILPDLMAPVRHLVQKVRSGNFSTNGKVFMPLPEILFISSFPPRECGIATYSQDLVKALRRQFSASYRFSICALETDAELHHYKSDDVKYILNTDHCSAFETLANLINADDNIRMVLVQHEFGFFHHCEIEFHTFLSAVRKPVILVFHTVLPNPGALLNIKVQEMIQEVDAVMVMTQSSANILQREYAAPAGKINMIPHGTHLVPHIDKEFLKKKYHLKHRLVLSTFGLLSKGKNIETTLQALPDIIRKYPDVIFLIIGKTHPSVVKQEGEQYRHFLEQTVKKLQLKEHVRFINQFLPLPELLDYLQLTDIYLFTSNDPNQAVSGTFSYAISSGCPVISTPIPHAKEVLQQELGCIIDFGRSDQLSVAVNDLLADEPKRKQISSNSLHQMAATAWENAAIAHARLFEQQMNLRRYLQYNLPELNLLHMKRLTTDFGMIQFSQINQPDILSGYTIDDNARAMVAFCQHFEATKEVADIKYLCIYLHFIEYCQQPNGRFLNYVDEHRKFTTQNDEVNLEDSNGRTIWALGHLLAIRTLIPREMAARAEFVLNKAEDQLQFMHSSRAMAFVIKGLYYRNCEQKNEQQVKLIRELANRLVQMYRHESGEHWKWFESYFTYGNSILPEAMLCAWLMTGDEVYHDIALISFDFLLKQIFTKDGFHVISNKGWRQKDKPLTGAIGGEQPIDVAYTILALNKFLKVTKNQQYQQYMQEAFNWFLGENHLHQILYNPCTGGCYDGLEEAEVNLNQGAESTVSYLMARMTMEKMLSEQSEMVSIRQAAVLPIESLVPSAFM